MERGEEGGKKSQRSWRPIERGGHLCRPIRARLRVTHSCHIWGDEGGASDLRSVWETREREREDMFDESGENTEVLKTITAKPGNESTGSQHEVRDPARGHEMITAC